MMDSRVIPLEDFIAATESGQTGKPKPKFVRTNTNAIMAMTFEPIRWTVPGYVSEGFTVLAGRQLGKTWLAIDWALAVACGGAAMGSIDCVQGNVLYIDI